MAAAALLLLLASTGGIDRVARRPGSMTGLSARPAEWAPATTAVEAVIETSPWIPLPATETQGPAEIARPAPKLASRETAKAPSAPSVPPAATAVPVASAAPGGVSMVNETGPRALPEAESPAEEPPSTPEGCDPPYTVDSKGIEHFKAVCL